MPHLMEFRDCERLAPWSLERRSLQPDQAGVPAEAGSSSVMPRWADLRLQPTIDFDISSAITLAIGLQVSGGTPHQTPPASTPPTAGAPGFSSLTSGHPSRTARGDRLLRELNTILDDARQRNPRTTFQIDLWIVAV